MSSNSAERQLPATGFIEKGIYPTAYAKTKHEKAYKMATKRLAQLQSENNEVYEYVVRS